MATTAQRPELLVIVGPTASGKSDLAIKIAKEFRGEIIAVDSRTIYKGMDIGTAKPSQKEQETVRHWGIDLLEPGQLFSARKFKDYADKKISEIQKRGKLPILVGGTGLYVDSVIFDFGFAGPADFSKRKELENLTTEQLQSMIKIENYRTPENFQNRRHLIRTIERKGLIGTKRSLTNNTLIIGLMPPNEVIKERILGRSELYFKKGLVKETRNLLNKFSEESILKTHGIAYAACIKLMKQEINIEEAKEMIQKQEWQYARRQRTWFRRNKFIRWYSSADGAYKEIANWLNT